MSRIKIRLNAPIVQGAQKVEFSLCNEGSERIQRISLIHRFSKEMRLVSGNRISVPVLDPRQEFEYSLRIDNKDGQAGSVSIDVSAMVSGIGLINETLEFDLPYLVPLPFPEKKPPQEEFVPPPDSAPAPERESQDSSAWNDLNYGVTRIDSVDDDLNYGVTRMVPRHSSGDTFSKRYDVLEEVGRGGFAVVYRAMDKRLNREVALKRLHVQTGDEVGQQCLERFRREAYTIASLNHPNIVQVYDYDQDDDGDYLVMEWVEGGSLKDRISRKSLDGDQKLKLMDQVCDGMGYAHQLGVIHRDIKPANILLSESSRGLLAKVADFGLARGKDVGDLNLSCTGMLMGTMHYMAPEQMEDAKSVTVAADVYALGKTFYELWTGDAPYQVDHTKLPSGLSDIILCCVKYQAEDRFPDASILKEALGRGR